MSQNGMILDYLLKGNTLTQAEAAEIFGCYRLSARIFDIRGLGFDIRQDMEQNVNRFGKSVRYARYWLKEKQNAGN